MKKALVWLAVGFALVWLFPGRVLAEVPNNKVGIHILEPGEIGKAANLVNSNGGDWGYVTIPIRSDDRDLKKWQKFMDEAARLHVIPIVRLATYGEGDTWVKPNFYSVLDFANFLSDLNWPVKRRYVVIYNEVNRAGEWGGEIDPEGYADILAFAQEIFASRNENFVVLPAGMDAAAPNVAGELMDEYAFLRRVARARPEIFRRLAGWTAHAYPNPDFSGQPWETHRMSILSYKKELAFVKQLGAAKNLPVFITETGWKQGLISPEQAAKFYEEALAGPWQDKQVLAITPFLLFAGDGPFVGFSFLDKKMDETPVSLAWKEVKKIAGAPEREEMKSAVAGITTEGNVVVPVAKQNNFWESLGDMEMAIGQFVASHVKLK